MSDKGSIFRTFLNHYTVIQSMYPIYLCVSSSIILVFSILLLYM